MPPYVLPQFTWCDLFECERTNIDYNSFTETLNSIIDSLFE